MGFEVGRLVFEVGSCRELLRRNCCVGWPFKVCRLFKRSACGCFGHCGQY